MVLVLTRRMRPTRLRIALALVAGVVGIVGVVGSDSGADAAPTTRVVAAKLPPRLACDGIKYRKIKGVPPTYGPHKLRDYPARKYTCRAYWPYGLDDDFVPQSVAIDGTTAWVSGYTWPDDVTHNRCRLQHIDLAHGALLADQSLLGGRRADGKYEECRHGGGLSLDANGLWISESGRLWLVDPAKVGVDPTHAVERYWDVQAPVRASISTTVTGQLFVGYYSKDPATSTVSAFTEDSLLAPDIQTLVGTVTPPGTDPTTGEPLPQRQVAPYSVQPIPTYSQGMNWFKGLVTTRSGGCGAVTLANGRRFGAIGGIEDIEYVPGGRVWVISERSARPMQSGKMVPMLSEYPTKKFNKLRGAGRC